MPQNSGIVFWKTDDRVERLKVMHADGLSLSAMAFELGTTRNAITGKIDRLKLPRNKNENGGLSHEARAKAANARRRNAELRRGEQKIKIPTFRVLPPIPDNSAADKQPMADIASGRPVTIFNLTSKTCRYPLGSAMQCPEFYCGCLPTENLPYCAEHASRCYYHINSRQREER